MRRFLLIAVIAALTACGGPTIHRHNVESKQASFSSTGQDSGIKDEIKENKPGFSVDQDWIDGYDSLLAKYGSTLTPPRKPLDRNGITKEGDRYRVNDAVMVRQVHLNQRFLNNRTQ